MTKRYLDWMSFAADTEKAFDSVDHNFIFATLTKFGFCDDFVKWVIVPFKGAKSCLVNIVVSTGFINIYGERDKHLSFEL